jgi:alpha-1,6-mannosyltransferase
LGRTVIGLLRSPSRRSVCRPRVCDDERVTALGATAPDSGDQRPDGQAERPAVAAAGGGHPAPGTAPHARHHWSARTARRVGFAGSLLLVVGSLGAGALPVYDPVSRWPVLGLLRRGAGPDVALGCVYAGLAVLALAWLYLGRSVRRGGDGTGTGDLLRTAVLWGAPLLAAAPLFSRDMYSYAAQAQLTHHGFDPYSNGPAALPGPFLDEVQRMWVDTPAPYGPLWLVLGAFVAAVAGNHVLLTVFVMRLLAVAGTVLIACFLPRLARRCGADPRWALWLALLNPLLLIHFVAGGHNDALMLGLIVAGLAVAVQATTDARLALGVVVVTLAALVKAPAAIAVAFLAPLWARRCRAPHAWLRGTARVAAVSLLTFTVVTVATGLGVGWVRQLNTPGAVVNWLSVPTGLGMLVDDTRRALGVPGDSMAIIDSFRLVGQLVTAVALVVMWARSFSGRAVRSLALALAVVVMLGPVVQPWYLLWPIVLGAAAPLPERARTLTAGVTVFLAMLITPQGATLINERQPVVTTGLAAIVATYVALAREQHHADAPGDGRTGVAAGAAAGADAGEQR